MGDDDLVVSRDRRHGLGRPLQIASLSFGVKRLAAPE
jgi:hypothetical protein